MALSFNLTQNPNNGKIAFYAVSPSKLPHISVNIPKKTGIELAGLEHAVLPALSPDLKKCSGMVTHCYTILISLV